MQTKQQMYSIASTLSTSSLDATIKQIRSLGLDHIATLTAIEFAQTIDKHYKRRNGFVPLAVIKLINGVA